MDGCYPALRPRGPPTLPEQPQLHFPLGLLLFATLRRLPASPRMSARGVCSPCSLGKHNRAGSRAGSSPPPLPGCVLAPIKEPRPRPHPLPLTCGLLVPNPRLGVEGTDIECGPMGELMTEKGGPMPLMGELRVLMGEWS